MIAMRLVLFFILICCASVQPLRGTTLLRYDLVALTGHAERVFVGTCKSVDTELVHGLIYTRALFTVKETIKGDAVDQIVLHLPGGQYQGTRSHISGMPVFSPGEDLVLFLTEKDELGHAWPVGLAQGKFRIEQTGAVAKARVFQALDGLTFYTPTTGAAKKTTESLSLNGLPLDEFLSMVRALVPPPRGEPYDAR